MRFPFAIACLGMAALPAFAQEAAVSGECGVFSTSYSHSISRCKGPEKDYLVYFQTTCATPAPCGHAKWTVLYYSCHGGLPQGEPWVGDAIGAPGCSMSPEYRAGLDAESARFRQSELARKELPPRSEMGERTQEDSGFFVAHARADDPDSPAVAPGAELAGAQPETQVEPVPQPQPVVQGAPLDLAHVQPSPVQPALPAFAAVAEDSTAPTGLMSQGFVEDYRPTEAYELSEFLVGARLTGISQTLWVGGRYYSVRATPGLELPSVGAEGRRMSLLLAGIRVTAARPLTEDEARDKVLVLLPQIQRHLQKRLWWLATMTSCKDGKLTTPFRMTFSYVPAQPGHDDAGRLKSDVYELGCVYDMEDFTEVPPLTLTLVGSN